MQQKFSLTFQFLAKNATKPTKELKRRRFYRCQFRLRRLHLDFAIRSEWLGVELASVPENLKSA